MDGTPVVGDKTEEGAQYASALTTGLLIQGVQIKCLLPKHLELIKEERLGFTLAYRTGFSLAFNQLSPTINPAGQPRSYQETFNKTFFD